MTCVGQEKRRQRRETQGGGSRGVSLIIVLIMLVVIGLVSAAAMRSAISNEMVARNFRYQLLAQQQAEAALRFCERQLMLPDDQRVVSLRAIASSASDPPTGWTLPATWSGTGSAGATLTAVPADLLSPSNTPQMAPQCLVEKRLWSAGEAYRVTARGYSANYTRDSQGYTSAGMVSWLQADLLIQPLDASPQASRLLKDRLWSRIVNPPF